MSRMVAPLAGTAAIAPVPTGQRVVPELLAAVQVAVGLVGAGLSVAAELVADLCFSDMDVLAGLAAAAECTAFEFAALQGFEAEAAAVERTALELGTGKCTASEVAAL